jgi:hypothetical protein
MGAHCAEAAADKVTARARTTARRDASVFIEPPV